MALTTATRYYYAIYIVILLNSTVLKCKVVLFLVYRIKAIAWLGFGIITFTHYCSVTGLQHCYYYIVIKVEYIFQSVLCNS